MKKKVIVGMSGGVDSSVAALLLKEQGYEVIGVTMETWDAPGAESVAEDAKRVADVLEIPHYVVDFRDVFREKVVNYFINEYEQGRTPNPCLVCNRYVKWEALLHRSAQIGCDYIATGHYGRIVQCSNGRFSVAKSDSVGKDQSYVLYNLTQRELSKTLFPLYEYDKQEIRRIAMENNIPVAMKKDSQDICFIPDHDYASFIQNMTGRKSVPGKFVDMNGNILGEHKGILHYTIGQRKGLGIAFGEPKFVVAIRPETNEVVLGNQEELMTSEVLLKDVNYMSVEDITSPMRVTGKLRYSQKDAACTLSKEADGSLRAVFDEPMRAPTPGQAGVFYYDNCIICGGTII